MAQHPLFEIEKLDAEYIKNIYSTDETVLSEGAMPAKYKLLVAMALDANNGDLAGVRVLTERAFAAGLKKEELLEAIKVIHHVVGAGKVFTISEALKGLF
jgi:alkylhydroperoxidase/carboxymuconolactone decarboxylase family protein YurZ